MITYHHFLYKDCFAVNYVDVISGEPRWLLWKDQIHLFGILLWFLHIRLCQYLTYCHLVWVGMETILIWFLNYFIRSFLPVVNYPETESLFDNWVIYSASVFPSSCLQLQRLLFHSEHRTRLNDELLFDIQNILPKQNFLSISQIGSRFVIDVSREQTKLKKNRFQPFKLCKFHMENRIPVDDKIIIFVSITYI